MVLTAVCADAYLHHLALESANPQRLAQFYSKIMNMDLIPSPSERSWRCEGPRRRIIIIEGRDSNLAYAGFACRDRYGLNELRMRAADEGILCLQSPSPYFEDGAFGVRDPDGNLICFGLAKPSRTQPNGLRGPIQHLTFASLDVEAFQQFYHEKLGFALSDRVIHSDGRVSTCFVRSNHEHHTLACFQSNRTGVDHHSYEAGEWDLIRDWCDHFARHDVGLIWGPGRHGPGNNLFVFVEDPDGNWIEVSAELEVIHDRQASDWPHSEKTLNRWGKAILRS